MQGQVGRERPAVPQHDGREQRHEQNGRDRDRDPSRPGESRGAGRGHGVDGSGTHRSTLPQTYYIGSNGDGRAAGAPAHRPRVHAGPAVPYGRPTMTHRTHAPMHAHARRHITSAAKGVRIVYLTA